MSEPTVNRDKKRVGHHPTVDAVIRPRFPSPARTVIWSTDVCGKCSDRSQCLRLRWCGRAQTAERLLDRRARA